MKLILRDGREKIVDTSFIFNNQYNTVDGERIYDTNVSYIEDDIRLGEFYCSSVKQGTYDEVLQSINEERQKIGQCQNCFWYHTHNRIADECEKTKEIIGNKMIIKETTIYEISCAYKPKYGEKCVHDIVEEPILFRETADCFFCKYPNGVPDQMEFKKFLIDNAEKYRIVPYFSCDKLSEDTSFMHSTSFGSYKLHSYKWSRYFVLNNARNTFKFYIDFENKKFILDNGIGYKVVDYLGVNEYNFQNGKSLYKAICNYDKFSKWLWETVDDYMSQKGK